ncbi:MAG: trimethylamine methyltransferase family protein, partial [Desulfobacterales bacterium]
MIQTGTIEKRSVSFRVLSDDQIEEIKRSAFEVMSKVGFRVHHQGARKMLKQAGALVNGEIVK